MLEKSGNFAHARSGENLRLIWVSKVGVAKWLDSATYTLSTVHLELRFTYKYKSWYTHVT